jgi:hypothetical protein
MTATSLCGTLQRFHGPVQPPKRPNLLENSELSPQSTEPKKAGVAREVLSWATFRRTYTQPEGIRIWSRTIREHRQSILIWRFCVQQRGPQRLDFFAVGPEWEREIHVFFQQHLLVVRSALDSFIKGVGETNAEGSEIRLRMSHNCRKTDRRNNATLARLE